MTRGSLLHRWRMKVAPAGLFECWRWLGAFAGPAGYGALYREGRNVNAARIGYELFFGPILKGLEADHLCNHPWCVNPLHIEPVTHKVNSQRRPRSRVKACPQGHPYDDVNTYVTPKGHRVCRICSRVSLAKYYTTGAGRDVLKKQPK